MKVGEIVNVWEENGYRYAKIKWIEIFNQMPTLILKQKIEELKDNDLESNL